MIYESYPWKEDLHKKVKDLIKYNTAKNRLSDDEKSDTVIEKSIFYSAFIIRKLIDCHTKLSDEACQYSMDVKAIRTKKSINLMRRWPEEGSHYWDHKTSVKVKGKDVCNWLIHSYIFAFEVGDHNTVESFFVSSDYDKNKVLYRILISDWIEYIKFIMTDDIVSEEMVFCEKKGDYIVVKKERG